MQPSMCILLYNHRPRRYNNWKWFNVKLYIYKRMLTTTSIFQRIALLIGWAKDQAGRIGNILENGERSVSMKSF